jgi:hypothetical protein
MKYNVTYKDIITFDEQTEESEGLKISGVAFKVGKIASKKIVIPRLALSDITRTPNFTGPLCASLRSRRIG